MTDKKRIWSESLLDVHKGSVGDMEFVIRLPKGSPCKDLRAVELSATPSQETGTIELSVHLHPSESCLELHTTQGRLKGFFGHLLNDRAPPEILAISGLPYTLASYGMQHALRDKSSHAFNRHLRFTGIDKAKAEVLSVLNQLKNKAYVPQEMIDCFGGIMEQLEDGLLNSGTVLAQKKINAASVALATLKSAKAASRVM